MTSAPIAAMETSRSMGSVRTMRARTAWRRIRAPATTAARTMSRSEASRGAGRSRARPSPPCPAPKGFTPAVRESAAARRIRAPASTGAPHGPRRPRSRVVMDGSFRMGPRPGGDGPGRRWGRAAGTGGGPASEGGEHRRVAGLAGRGDDLVGGGERGIVLHLDAAGGELHRDVLDAGQAAHALLDLRHARGAAEALRAEEGAGRRTGGGGHGEPFSGGSDEVVPSS